MTGRPTVELTLASWGEAQTQYDRGLRHGVLRLPGHGDLEVAQRIRIRLDLPFAGKQYLVEGEVADVDADGAMVFLEIMPVGLRMLFDDEDATAPPARGADEEPTRDSGDHEASESAMVAIYDALAASDGPDDNLAAAALAHVARGPDEDDEDDDERVIEIDRGSVEDDSWSLMIVESDDPETCSDGEAGRDLDAASAAEVLTSVAPFLVDDLGPPGVPRLEGTVEEMGWARLLASLLRHHLTGVLEVGEGAERSVLSVRYGHVVHVQRFPPMPDRRMREALRLGLMDEALAARLALLGRATGMPLMGLVDRLSPLDADRREELRRRLLVDDVGAAVRRGGGPFRFWRVPEVEGLFEVAPGAGLLAVLDHATETLRDDAEGLRDALLAEHGGDHVHLTPLGVEVQRTLGLDDDQQRVLRRLVERDTPLARVVRAEEDEAFALSLVAALLQMELVDVVPHPSGPERDRFLAERRLREAHARLDGDRFAQVGGHWTDDPATLERLVRSACAVVDDVPARLGEPEELETMRQEMMGALEQVALTLLRASPRRAYRETLVPPGRRRLAAAQVVREAAALVEIGRADEARARCRTALELDPGGAEGAEVRGQARRLLDRLIGVSG